MGDDDLKILPGQVRQLTSGPDPAGNWQGSQSATRRRRGGPSRYTPEGPREIDLAETVIDAGGHQPFDWERPQGPCQRCHERPATVTWAPDGTMGLIHGGYQFWCARCALRVQVEHARSCAAQLPELERQLAAEEAR